MDIKDKEKYIYNEILKLKNGNDQDKSFAFHCIGFLGNESIDIPLEKKLEILQDKIEKYTK